MRMYSRVSLIPLVAALLIPEAPVQAEGSALDEAVALLKKIHADRCERHSLRGQVMVAHRAHDQKTLNQIYPLLDEISRKLKPDEDRIKALQAIIEQNSADQNAMESAVLEMGECD